MREDELRAIARAEQLALSTGKIHTVWFDHAALECFIRCGTDIPVHCVCCRIQECRP